MTSTPSPSYDNLPELVDCHVHLYPERMRRAVKQWFQSNSDWELPDLEWDTSLYDRLLRENARQFLQA